MVILFHVREKETVEMFLGCTYSGIAKLRTGGSGIVEFGRMETEEMALKE